MTDHLSRQLVTLRAGYRARALKDPGDHHLQDPLPAAYLTQAMLLLSSVYGQECAEQVRVSAPPGTRPAPGRLGAALRRYWAQWFSVWPSPGAAAGPP